MENTYFCKQRILVERVLHSEQVPCCLMCRRRLGSPRPLTVLQCRKCGAPEGPFFCDTCERKLARTHRPHVIRKWFWLGSGLQGLQAWGPSGRSITLWELRFWTPCVGHIRAIHPTTLPCSSRVRGCADYSTQGHLLIICAPLLENKHCFLEYLSAHRTQRDRQSVSHSKPLPYQCL